MGVEKRETWGQWDSPPPRNILPEGLEQMAPGPELGRVLESIDRTVLNGHELVVLLGARSRQLSFSQAELYADMAELAHCPPGTDASDAERGVVDEYASDEVRVALVWTRRAADHHLGLALDLFERLPRVWSALRRGDIDLPRARVICQSTGHLADDQARRVTDEILEEASGLTTGQIGARLRRLCVSVDPDDAKRRYQEAVEQRRVIAEPDPDGTGTLTGLHLAPERVAAAMARINHLARKLGDDGRSMDQKRADVFLDLLEGIQHPTVVRRGVVDIRVKLTTLAGLDDHPGDIPGWGPVIADIAHRAAHPEAQGGWRSPTPTPVRWSGAGPLAADPTPPRPAISTPVSPPACSPAAACPPKTPTSTTPER